MSFGHIKRYGSAFEEDVVEGLTLPLKKIPPKYFYDENGDKLFQEIMELEEYYLPACETEILINKAEDISALVQYEMFDVVELGAGDGRKTVKFLNRLSEIGVDASYIPLDISHDVLRTNSRNILSEIPDMKISPLPGDYFDTLPMISGRTPKLVMFMGSNIGNFEFHEAVEFLRLLKANMTDSDKLMIGFDLRKNPRVILNAYDDSKGVTRRFNLNLLERINRELGANFDLNSFDHYTFYDPIRGTVFSFLVSLKDQLVTVAGRSFRFERFELIHTEVSQKYSLHEIEAMALDSGYRSINHFTDSRNYFSVSVFGS